MRNLTEDYTGLCQACLGQYKVADSGLMVLHGYKRPGDGSVYGRCLGVDHPPFEYDFALTVEIIVGHRAQLVEVSRWRDRLQAGEVRVLTRRWTEYEGRTRIDREEAVGPDSKYWPALLAGAISRAENEIWFLREMADHLQARVNVWERQNIIGIDVPPTGRVRGMVEPYAPLVEAEKARLAVARSAREAKPGKLKLTLFWDRVGREEVSDIELAAIKDWSKAIFTVGRLRVSVGYDFSDVPHAVRRADPRSRLVVILNLDWSYRDALAGLIPDAHRIEWAKKQVEFYADVTVAKPWQIAAARSPQVQGAIV